MYNLGDLSYKIQPKFIEDHTIVNFACKMLIHAKENNMKIISIIIHGGEPLLLSKKRFLRFINSFNHFKDHEINVIFALQTNGILITDEWCEIFKTYNIHIGVSLDGKKELNDTYRLDKNGKGTFDDVMKGMDVLRKNKVPFGVLSVLNLAADPLDYYENFKSINITSLDVLFLEMNHDTKFSRTTSDVSVAEWYIKLFEAWYRDKDAKIKLRLFDTLIREILGEKQTLDALGVSENNILVLETNGGLEAVDVLKMCGDSFTKNELNINKDLIEDVKNSDLINIYYNSGKYLAKKCLACPIVNICGGGYLPHRYSSENGFNNPSIYCDDLLRIITHIQNAVFDTIPTKLVEESGLEKLTYHEAVSLIEENMLFVSDPEYVSKLESFKKSKCLPVLNTGII